MGISEVVLLFQATKRAHEVVQLLFDENWEGGIIANSTVILNPDILHDFGDYFSSHKVVGVADILDENKQEEIDDFLEQYEEYYGERIEYIDYAGSSVDLIDVLVEVLKNSKSVRDTKELSERLHLLQHIGLRGNVSFDKHGNLRDSFSLMKFNKGKFVKFEE